MSLTAFFTAACPRGPRPWPAARPAPAARWPAAPAWSGSSAPPRCRPAWAGAAGFLAFFPFFAGLGLGAGGRGAGGVRLASSLTAPDGAPCRRAQLRANAVSAAIAFFCARSSSRSPSAVADGRRSGRPPRRCCSTGGQRRRVGLGLPVPRPRPEVLPLLPARPGRPCSARRPSPHCRRCRSRPRRGAPDQPVPGTSRATVRQAQDGRGTAHPGTGTEHESTVAPPEPLSPGTTA